MDPEVAVGLEALVDSVAVGLEAPVAVVRAEAEEEGRVDVERRLGSTPADKMPVCNDAWICWTDRAPSCVPNATNIAE